MPTRGDARASRARSRSRGSSTAPRSGARAIASALAKTPLRSTETAATPSCCQGLTDPDGLEATAHQDGDVPGPQGLILATLPRLRSQPGQPGTPLADELGDLLGDGGVCQVAGVVLGQALFIALAVPFDRQGPEGQGGLGCRLPLRHPASRGTSPSLGVVPLRHPASRGTSPSLGVVAPQTLMWLVRGLDGREGDGLTVDEGVLRPSLEDPVDRADDLRCRAPVGAQGIEGLGLQIGLGLHISEDVAAAEAVDGLLGVADHDQADLGLPDIEAAEDAVLDRVGVLELVDHGCRETAADGLGQGHGAATQVRIEGLVQLG